MMKNKKFLIFEGVMVLVIIAFALCIFFVDLDLGIFKFVSQKTLVSQYTLLNDLQSKLTTTITNYDTSTKAVETSKVDYKKQKDQYDAITDETISIIKEATTDEKYNIEYMWVKLGNYAKSNNLTLALVEPGGNSSSAAGPTTSTTSSTTSQAPAATSSTSSTNELTIKVKGNYINVSDFIFELENDKELRFKLDKIKMEYAGSNQISATFAVKNIVFIK